MLANYSGLKVNDKFLSNNTLFPGSGNGDDRRTAFSMDRRTVSSPLQRTVRTSMTSPLGS
jgi:hypothetical protein